MSEAGRKAPVPTASCSDSGASDEIVQSFEGLSRFDFAFGARLLQFRLFFKQSKTANRD